jgi:hypothetical protein
MVIQETTEPVPTMTSSFKQCFEISLSMLTIFVGFTSVLPRYEH